MGAVDMSAAARQQTFLTAQQSNQNYLAQPRSLGAQTLPSGAIYRNPNQMSLYNIGQSALPQSTSIPEQQRALLQRLRVGYPGATPRQLSAMLQQYLMNTRVQPVARQVHPQSYQPSQLQSTQHAFVQGRWQYVAQQQPAPPQMQMQNGAYVQQARQSISIPPTTMSLKRRQSGIDSDGQGALVRSPQLMGNNANKRQRIDTPAETTRSPQQHGIQNACRTAPSPRPVVGNIGQPSQRREVVPPQHLLQSSAQHASWNSPAPTQRPQPAVKAVQRPPQQARPTHKPPPTQRIAQPPPHSAQAPTQTAVSSPRARTLQQASTPRQSISTPRPPRISRQPVPTPRPPQKTGQAGRLNEVLREQVFGQTSPAPKTQTTPLETTPLNEDMLGALLKGEIARLDAQTKTTQALTQPRNPSPPPIPFLQGPLTKAQNGKAAVRGVQRAMKKYGPSVGANPDLDEAAPVEDLLEQRYKWSRLELQVSGTLTGGSWLPAHEVMRSAVGYVRKRSTT